MHMLGARAKLIPNALGFIFAGGMHSLLRDTKFCDVNVTVADWGVLIVNLHIKAVLNPAIPSQRGGRFLPY